MPPKRSARIEPLHEETLDSEETPVPEETPAPDETEQEPLEDHPQIPEELEDLARQSTEVSDEEPNLARAIMLLTKEFRSRDKPKKAKAKEPDTFDGTDSRKLNNFILLCNLYFRNSTSYDDDDEAKVNFALSYLRGTALEYFEPSILDSDEVPDWIDNWSAFVRTLRTQFGPIDPTGEAEAGIDYLKMYDNQRIVKYNVEFNRLAIRTGWDDSVLRHRYYSGLAERIKDVMGQQGKPSTLEDMKTLAHSIDSRHWERLREKSRSSKSKSDEKPDRSDNNRTDRNPKIDDRNKSVGNFKGKHKPDFPNKTFKPPSTSGSTSISDKLGKDGKLTQTERQRRFDNNLCMFCGGVGHLARECPKSSKVKVRAAHAKDKEPAVTTADSKKS